MNTAFPCSSNGGPNGNYGTACGNWSNFGDQNEISGQIVVSLALMVRSLRGQANTTGTFPTGGVNGGVSVHHTGQANFLFTDGHVKSMNPLNTTSAACLGSNNAANTMWDRTRN